MAYDIYDAPNDEALVENVAREILTHHGDEALLWLKAKTDEATRISDELSARAWLDITEAALDLLLQRFLHPCGIRSAGLKRTNATNARSSGPLRTQGAR